MCRISLACVQREEALEKLSPLLGQLDAGHPGEQPGGRGLGELRPGGQEAVQEVGLTEVRLLQQLDQKVLKGFQFRL